MNQSALILTQRLIRIARHDKNPQTRKEMRLYIKKNREGIKEVLKMYK